MCVQIQLRDRNLMYKKQRAEMLKIPGLLLKGNPSIGVLTYQHTIDTIELLSLHRLNPTNLELYASYIQGKYRTTL